MSARVIMKDIAAELGVSINTVHKALTGKAGVSESVRSKVNAKAEAMGYHRNTSASSLRRKDINLVFCLPRASREGAYFFRYLWEGCNRFEQEVIDRGITVERVEFGVGGYADALEQIDERLQVGEKIDGLLAYTPGDDRATELLGQIAEAGVTIELVDGDRPHLDRLGASLADYSTAGSLMAEQAANLVHASGTDTRVLLLAGDPYTDSHYLTARAFHNYLREHNVPWQVEDLTGAHAQVKQLEHELNQRLKSSEAPELICSVFAVGSELIADALVAANKAGEVMVIGNDLFPESALALRRGIFTNIVYKDPVSLAYRGAKTLGDYLLWGKTPAEPVQKGAVEMVFASNVDRYCELAGI